jgi:hypothetical protein
MKIEPAKITEQLNVCACQSLFFSSDYLYTLLFYVKSDKSDAFFFLLLSAIVVMQNPLSNRKEEEEEGRKS